MSYSKGKFQNVTEDDLQNMTEEERQDFIQDALWNGNPPDADEDYSKYTFPVTLEKDGPFGNAGDVIDLN
ncbi:MAG: hypothetical protein HFH60_03705 [Lachnospiraceae bacterium]|nr:hypothetical protein [Lachnospiraceae bacterium]